MPCAFEALGDAGAELGWRATDAVSVRACAPDLPPCHLLAGFGGVVVSLGVELAGSRAVACSFERELVPLVFSFERGLVLSFVVLRPGLVSVFWPGFGLV
jgi:hypothetical protein